MKTPRKIAMEVDQVLREHFVKRLTWEKYQAPVPETWYCEACDSEADQEDKIDHADFCPIWVNRDLNFKYFVDADGDQPA